MSFFNKLKKYSKLRMAMGLILVGLILAIIGGIVLVKPSGDTVKVPATIKSIETDGTDADDNPIYKVVVSYKAEGKKFETELGAYENGWKVGDVIECNYEKGHPENIGYGNGKMVALIVCAAGVLALGYGIISLKKGISTPSSELAQYDRVDESKVDPEKRAEVENNTEPLNEYVFHFTGKMNQSYVMKDKFGKEVFEAICDGITLVKDTDFEFKNNLTGKCETKKIGHTTTTSIGNGLGFGGNISSSFKIDGKNCWEVLANMGYGFEFSLNGIKCHYDVKRYGVPVGTVETAGTEVMNEKYENNPLAKIPSNGIYKISCKESDVEGMFLICFCVTKTEVTLS